MAKQQPQKRLDEYGHRKGQNRQMRDMSKSMRSGQKLAATLRKIKKR